jgi:hypothetical protein
LFGCRNCFLVAIVSLFCWFRFRRRSNGGLLGDLDNQPQPGGALARQFCGSAAGALLRAQFWGGGRAAGDDPSPSCVPRELGWALPSAAARLAEAAEGGGARMRVGGAELLALDYEYVAPAHWRAGAAPSHSRWLRAVAASYLPRVRARRPGGAGGYALYFASHANCPPGPGAGR